jgi:ribonucleoside-triphosphate reductase
MPYITVTPLFSVCEKHGYLRGRHDFCPLCDQELIDRARTEEQPELPLF